MARSFPILFIAPVDPVDAVWASGLIKRLADETPGARFTIVASPKCAPLFAQVPGLEKLLVTPRMAGFWAVFSLWWTLRPRRWSLVLDAAHLGLARFLKRERRGKERVAKPFEHKVVGYAGLLGLEDEPPAPFLFPDAEADQAAAELTAGEGPILALAPGADWIGRAWPAERFAQVAARLLADDGPLAGGRLLVLGGQAHREAVTAAKFAVPRQRVIARPLDASPLLDLALLSRTRLLIGNDGFWAALASAAGVPTLAVFGPSDEAVNAPYGPSSRAVRGPRPYEAFLAADPRLDQAVGHMLDLPVDTVLEAAHQLLEQTKKSHG